ncbi:MAG: hypothetical protein HY856_13445 [Burkholderiales bacterium]|nr:hypothetical protein [Burkholderiales bacterium]
MVEAIKRLLRTPTPIEMLQRQLSDAERARVEALAEREYMEHAVAMLDARIQRIRGELQGGAA